MYKTNAVSEIGVNEFNSKLVVNATVLYRKIGKMCRSHNLIKRSSDPIESGGFSNADHASVGFWCPPVASTVARSF